MQVLYHVLGWIPSYQNDIQPLLCELCAGLKSEELFDVSCIDLTGNLEQTLKGFKSVLEMGITAAGP